MAVLQFIVAFQGIWNPAYNNPLYIVLLQAQWRVFVVNVFHSMSQGIVVCLEQYGSFCFYWAENAY